MDPSQLKQQALEEVNRRQDEIIGIARAILAEPELGFKEWRTAATVKRVFANLGLPVREGLAITGVDATLVGKEPGPTVVVMGELDSVMDPKSPVCDPSTGAAHLCGHNLQIAAMLGTAMGLVGSGFAEHMAGTVRFLAVPAEEFIEIEYRLGLVKQGKLTCVGGKPELVKLGYFDDVDLAMMVHAQADCPQPGFFLRGETTGFVAKFVQFRGVPAHAGGSPHMAVNALNAACLAILAIHAQRETFQDKDSIRVHPIITRGGDIVNIVPADVRLETYVRGRTMEAIVDASKKVDRALRGSADSVGAEVEITGVPGYLPMIQDKNLSGIAEQNGRMLLGERGAIDAGFSGGSTDMGDLCHLMPGLHVYIGGIEGAGHTSNFHVADWVTAAVDPARLMAACVVDLLAGGAAEAQRVKAEFKPALTKEQYLKVRAELAGAGHS